MPCDMRLRPPLSLRLSPTEAANAARLLGWEVTEEKDAIAMTLPDGRVVLLRKTDVGEDEARLSMDRYQIWGVDEVKDQLMQAHAMVQMVDKLQEDGYSVLEQEINEAGEVEVVLERY